MASTWRRFAFFSQHEHPQTEGQWLRGENISACCPLDDGRLVIADRNGICHILGRDHLEEVASFGAHDRGVSHLVQPRGSSLLFSLGTESDGAFARAFIRIWRTDEMTAIASADSQSADEGARATLPCARALRVFSGAAAEPLATSWCVADDLSQIAVGLADGSAMLMRTTDVLRERFIRFKPLPSIKPAPSGVGVVPAPVRGVFFCHGSDHAPTDLWVLRRDALLSISGGALRHEVCRTLAEGWTESGSAEGCACVSSMQELVLGRQEAVFFYSAEERGACFAFAGTKLQMEWHRAFLLLLHARADTPPREGEVVVSPIGATASQESMSTLHS